jgi:ribonuclease J
MEERWKKSPTWLSLIPRKYYIKLGQLEPLQADKNNVMAIPVSYSAHPAYALLYFGKTETVLYTGDFRLDSFLDSDESFELKGGQTLLDFLDENPDIKVDKLILEGTNVGSNRLPVAPKEAVDIIRRIILSNKLVIAILYGLDLEYTYALMKLAAELNLNCYIASAQTAKLLEKVAKLPVKPKLKKRHS